MNNNYVFYRMNSEETLFEYSNIGILDGYDIEVFTPSLFKLKKHSGKQFIYLFWLFFTRGRYRIIYTIKDDVIIHYTHILPKFFKFPFMQSCDLEIGPAWTHESYRGKGIFPAVAAYAVQYFKKIGCTFYIFAHIDNISSQKAVLKAGFHEWANGYKTDKLGIYKVVK